MMGTGIKDSANSAVVSDPDMRTVHVKWSKLTEGISMVFAGVLNFMEALDPVSTNAFMENLSKATAKHEANDTVKKEARDYGTEVSKSRSDDPVPVDTAPVGDAEPVKVEDKKASVSASSVTLDDITRAIVQKIKQNRSNNEKIAQLLKNYGVARVSEIPAEKREAFLVEVASI